MKFRKVYFLYLSCAILAGIAAFAAYGCGNKTSQIVNGGVDVTEHKMGNGVICYTAQLGHSVSIDCK